MYFDSCGFVAIYEWWLPRVLGFWSDFGWRVWLVCVAAWCFWYVVCLWVFLASLALCGVGVIYGCRVAGLCGLLCVFI